MKAIRLFAVLTFSFLIIATLAIWWSWPDKVDMARYAPGDALVYIEVNNLADVTTALKGTEIMSTISPALGITSTSGSKWSLLAAKAGIGPAQTVIFSRAQLALVVLGVNTQTSEDALRIKPEAALIVETQTPKWRMRSVAVENIKRLAQFAYGNATCVERNGEKDYVECTEPARSRKLIGAIEGSTVIIGNSDKTVDSCLAVRRGQRPNLSSDSDLIRSRKDLQGESALGFGYVSPANSARLVSLGIPLLMGKAPGDSQFEDLLMRSAAKVLRGMAWTSKFKAGRIEDHYQISLDPQVTTRLGPAFEIAEDDDAFWKLVPASFRSLTIYRSKDPQAAWFSLDSAASMKLDAVSTVLIASLLKSGLSSYGLENPKDSLATMAPPLVTIRPALGEGSLLLARVKNEQQLRKILATAFVEPEKGQILSGLESQPNREKEFTAIFVDGFLMVGRTEQILVYLDQLRHNETLTGFQSLSLSQHPGSAIVTYTNERDTISSIITGLAQLNGQKLSQNAVEAIEAKLTNDTIASTESRLNEQGIDRRTLSAFGQFGFLLSLAFADSSNSSSR